MVTDANQRTVQQVNRGVRQRPDWLVDLLADDRARAATIASVLADHVLTGRPLTVAELDALIQQADRVAAGLDRAVVELDAPPTLTRSRSVWLVDAT